MKKQILTLGIALLMSIPGVPSFAGSSSNPSKIEDSDGVSPELQKAIDAVYPALVRIEVVAEQGEGGRMRKVQAAGSGTIISKDGYVLTNHHVAGRATRIVCRLPSGEYVDAKLVGTDALSDLAVIKLDLSSRRNPKAPLPVAKFGDSDKLKVGDVVLAMGSPSGLSQSVTKGIVANTAMILPFGESFPLDGENVGDLIRWIGHDAIIYHGNSGGPLVNLKGEIVGINEVGIATMGGAIPSNIAKKVAKELIEHGSVSRSWIGVEVQPLLKEMTDAKGILVSSVETNSPGKAAGILPGDFITEVNGQTVVESRSPEDLPLFNQMVLSAPVGSKMIIKGVRNGKPQTWELTTKLRERNLANESEIAEWGLTVRNFTRTMVEDLRRPNRNGVLIDSIRPGGPAEEAKPALHRDDTITHVNGQEITNTEALVKFTKSFVKGLTEPKPVLVTYERDSTELMTVVKIGPEIESEPPSQTARPWLGLTTQPLTADLADALGMSGKMGVRVTKISPDSPAKKAGIKTGDIFLKLDDQVIRAHTLSDQELFENLILEYKIGSEIALSGVRDGQPLNLTVKLTDQPKPAVNLAETKDDLFQFKARDLSYDDRVDAELPTDTKGVRIVSVERAGWAALAGLSSGDIVYSMAGKPVDSIATLKTILAQLRETKPRRIALFIQRGVHTKYLEIEPRW
jgi:serine protease Do